MFYTTSSPAKLLRMAVAVACLWGLSSEHVLAVVTFDWATVGNPGNGADTTGLGAVSDTFLISKHEVTNGQGSGSTESGVYTMNNRLTETRGTGATTFFLRAVGANR